MMKAQGSPNVKPTNGVI